MLNNGLTGIILLLLQAAAFAQAPVLVLQKGHFKKVNSISFSKDGRQLVTTGDDGTIKIWDPFSRKLLNELESDGNRLSDAHFISNDSFVAASSASLYQTVPDSKVWNAATGQMLPLPEAVALRKQEANNEKSTSKWTGDGFTSPGGKMFVKQPESDILFLPDSPYKKVIADTPILIHSVIGNKSFHSIRHYMGNLSEAPRLLGFVSDSSLLIVLSHSLPKGVYTRYAVYDFVNNRESFSFSDTSTANKKGQLLFAPGGHYFVHYSDTYGDESNPPFIEIWDIAAQKMATRRTAQLLTYAISGQQLALCFMQQNNGQPLQNDTSYGVAVFNLHGEQEAAWQLPHKPSVICFSNNDQYLATGNEDGNFSVWELAGATAKLVSTTENEIDPVLSIHNDFETNKMFYVTRNMYGMQVSQTSGKIAHVSTGSLAIKKRYYFLNDRYSLLDVGIDEFTGRGKFILVSNDTPSVIKEFPYNWNYDGDAFMSSLPHSTGLQDDGRGKLTVSLQHPELQSVSFYTAGINATRAGPKWRVDNGPPPVFAFVIIKSLHAADTLMLYSSFGDFVYNKQMRGYIYRGFGNYFMAPRDMAIYPISNGIKLMWSVLSSDAGYVIGRKPDEAAKFRVGAAVKADPHITSDAYLYCLDIKNNFKFRTPLTFKKDSICDAGSFVISPNGQTACILSTESTQKANFIRVINARSGAPLYNLKSKNSSFVSGIEYTKDSRCIYSWSEGGGVCVKWDIITGRELYSLVFFNDHDYAIILPDGYYYISSKADARFLNFKLNNRLYNFSQFDLQYNRPDVVLKAIGSTDSVLIQKYYAAWQNRIKKSGFDPTGLGNQLVVPQVTIQKDSIPAYTQQKEIELHFSMEDSIFYIRRYNVFINDVPLNGISGRLLNDGIRSASIAQKVLLTEGINKIQINCTNEKAVESRKETVYVNYAPLQPPAPKTWFIGIGINQYSAYSSFVDLSYCVKDIRDLCAALKEKFNEDIFIDTLFNEAATKENILGLRKKLMQTGVDDKVIISFSGHGMVDPGNQHDFYFVTGNTQVGHPEENGISYAQMEELLDSIPARKKLLLLDACHSGEQDDNLVGSGSIPGTKKGAGENDRPAGSIEIIDIVQNKNDNGDSASDIYQLMKDAFVDIRRNNGAYVLSAAQSNEAAGEGGGISNGWFTACLITQLRGNTGMTINELSSRVNKCVNQQSGGNQNTDNRQELAEFNWQLW